MANILKRTTDHIFYGTKTKNNRPVIGCYVTVYNTTTSTFFGQTQTDANGNWTITVNSPNTTPGIYEIRFYGSGLKAALPPEGDWETLTVTSTGLDALNVVLSIYTSSVTCENDGTVIAGQLGSTGTAQTHINAYYGVTSLTAVNTVPGVGQYTISGIVTSGLSASINTSTKQDVYITSFPAANNYGYVDISVYANPIGSGIISTTKRFTVSKSRKGNDGGSGIIGPSLVYAGTWSAARTYTATSGLVEAVKGSDANYYYARVTNINHDPISSPTYWTYFSNQFSSVATDLLLAQDVAVGRGITLGTSTADGGSAGFIKTSNVVSKYSGSGVYMLANAGGTGVVRAGLVDGTNLTRGFIWDGDTSTFIVKAANVTIDSSGNITAEGGTVGGWTISSAALYKNTGTDATSAGMAPGDYPFYAGKQYASRATAPFRVTPAGAMTATSGSIGGWTISSTSLTGGSNPGLSLVVGLNTDTSLGNPVIYAGDADPASAPFQVFEDGSMVASSANITGTITTTAGFIGGWAINTNYLGNGGLINMYSGANNTARIEVGTGATAGGINSAAVGSDIIFWGGAAHASRASAPFRVTASGLLSATGANISGTLTSEDGIIGGWHITPTSIYSGNMILNSDEGRIEAQYTPGTAGWALLTDGSAEFNDVTVRGTIYSLNGGRISNWYINTYYLGNGGSINMYGGADNTARIEVGTGSTYAGINSAAASVDIAFWSGATHASRASAPFRVTAAGALTATSATISGVITAGSGSIGGWTINPTTLSKNDATLDSAGSLTLGTSNDIVKLSSTDGTYRLWIGNASAASAKFSVTKAGSMYAELGTVAGWSIDANRIYHVNSDDVVYMVSNSSGAPGIPVTAGFIVQVADATDYYAGVVKENTTGAATNIAIFAGFENGGVSLDEAPFYVRMNGELNATGIYLKTSGTGTNRIELDSTATAQLRFVDSSNATQITMGDSAVGSAPGITITNGIIQATGSSPFLTTGYFTLNGTATNFSATLSASHNGKPSGTDRVSAVWARSTVTSANGGINIGIFAYASTDNGTPYAGYFGYNSTGDGVVRIQDKIIVGGRSSTPTTSAYGIVFGSNEDTNLYRSTTDSLKTDDSFTVGATLYIGADTNLYRSAANVLKTDDTFNAAAFQLAGTDINTAGTLSNVAYENQANSFNSTQTINTGNSSDELELGQKAYPGIINFVTEGTSGGTIYTRLTSTSPSANDSNKTIYLPDSSGTLALIGINNNFSTTQTVTGDIRATGEVISYYSDGRLKDNIQPLTNALDRLLAVRGVEFDWSKNTVPSRQLKHDVGVVAQEVMKVLPEAVTEPWSAERLGPKYHSVLYEKLIPLIIEAIRELKEEIDGKRTAR